MTGYPAARKIDGTSFRRVLGHYPTGVCVVTALEATGEPVAMVVGSFTSVSLDPPLVAFFPDRESRTWPRIERAGRFRVSVLGARQQALCARFAARNGDKFAGLDWRVTEHGTPAIDDVVAWIDCVLDATHEAGDHFIAIGRVLDLAVASDEPPLVFLRGGYGGFSPLTMLETS